MKTNDHFELQATGEIYHNEVRDFFKFPIVKRALGMLWNEYCAGLNENYTAKTSHILEKYSDFTIDNPAHLGFLRDVFGEEEDLRIFFQNLRESAIESGGIGDIAENYMSITQMILSMQYLVDVVEGPYGMDSFLDEKIMDIVSENSYKTFQSLENPEEVRIELGDYERLLNLTASGFSPISQYGDIVRSDQLARPYQVVHDAVINGEDEDGELETLSICINKTGKVYEGIERLQAFITQNRCVIEEIEKIKIAVNTGVADENYMQRVANTFALQGIFPLQSDPDFIPEVLEELLIVLADAKKQLKYFCEELGKNKKIVGDDTKEYDPLKNRLLAERKRDFPTVGARIKGVK